MSDPLRLGVVGAGGFAAFAVPHLLDVGAVVATAVADADPDRAARMASDLDAAVVYGGRALRAVHHDSSASSGSTRTSRR